MGKQAKKELAHENEPAPVSPRLKFNLRSLLARRTKAAPNINTGSLEPSQRNRFFSAVARIKESELYLPLVDHKAPYGYYDGRHVIGESNQIQGGVYLGLIPHEAVVVDDKFGLLVSIYQNLFRRLAQHREHHRTDEAQCVQILFGFVREHLRLNTKGVRDMAFDIGIGPDRKAALDFYIKRRVAAPRHQVLLAGYLIQRASAAKILGGHMRILPDHGELPGEDEKLIYICADGTEILFDPLAQ